VTWEALNLEAICAALDDHASKCDFEVLAIALNPLNHERLDWEEIRGIPVRPDEHEGRLRIECAGQHGNGAHLEATLAEGQPRELVPA
jgi:hypothetical protein